VPTIHSTCGEIRRCRRRFGQEQFVCGTVVPSAPFVERFGGITEERRSSSMFELSASTARIAAAVTGSVGDGGGHTPANIYRLG